MKCLERNKTFLYYSLFLDKSPIYDEYGNESGEFVVNYAEPVIMKANVSPAKGVSSVEQFGSDIEYDKIIVTDDLSCPIDENSVLFIDRAPSGENSAFDYIVKKVARSLNSVSIAVSKVSVS